jgi:nitrite reductase/ring-hydroxylating ferredoxin subunit
MADEVTVGRAEDVPDGEMRVFQVGGDDVAVANVDGTFYAFGDTCSHQFCSLSEGDLEETTVECPCHGSQFDVTTGEVLHLPATQPIPSFDVAVENGEIRIGGAR